VVAKCGDNIGKFECGCNDASTAVTTPRWPQARTRGTQGE
jgi:hypothetical protein